MIPTSCQSEPEFLDLLQATARYLWKDWPRDMKLSSISENGFTLVGTCPHPNCRKEAAFEPVTRAYDEPSSYYGNSTERRIAALRCIACNEYILGLIHKVDTPSGFRWVYEEHYPLGRPDDKADDSIPEPIRMDYQEALRCRWVNAYNATIEMCRRSLESSCIGLGANKDLVLNDMIKWVHSQGKITTPLSDMAHKIKLGGNRAAHPSDKTLTDKDADAVLEFTREYFQHVYVMPARMDKFDFDKPGKDKKKP